VNAAVAPPCNDVELHDRLLARDPSALLECVDRFGASVYCIALAQGGSVARAEDLTEQAFVELWRHPEAFDPRRAPLVLQVVRWLRSALAATPAGPPAESPRARLLTA
jgi:hypothetical protein